MAPLSSHFVFLNAYLHLVFFIPSPTERLLLLKPSTDSSSRTAAFPKLCSEEQLFSMFIQNVVFVLMLGKTKIENHSFLLDIWNCKYYSSSCDLLGVGDVLLFVFP